MVSETFLWSYTSPHNHLWIFETLWVIIFWVRVTHKILNVNWGKNSLNNFICHLSWLKKLSPAHTHSLKTFREFLKPYELLFSELVTHKILNVNWEKIHSIILSVTCHGFRNFPNSYTSPHIHSWIFKTLQVIIFWVRVTHKILNVNWEKIHSIILSVTCHGFRNFPPLIHIPSYPFMNFQTPASYYFLS